MNNPASEKIKSTQAPDQPGVYLMQDKRKTIIYVGKAISLKKRLRSYARPLEKLDRKTQLLVEQIHDIELMITPTEVDALMLEYNLIKKHRPKYNIIMRDDKSYPYLKITDDQFFPRLLVTRRPFVDEADYFGPYIGLPLKQIARDLSYYFKLCLKKIPLDHPVKKRGCLYFQMQQCSGVCLGKITIKAYQKQVNQLRAFLAGKQDKLTPELSRKMKTAAQQENFEQAATFRDQLEMYRQLRDLPAIRSVDREDKDVIALARSGQVATAEIFKVRQGNLEGRRNFFLQHVGVSSDRELAAQLLTQYYAGAVRIPPLIIMAQDIADHALIGKWLSKRRDGEVVIRSTNNAEEIKLAKMAETNAWLYLRHRDEELNDELSDDNRAILENVKQQLQLEQLPIRIECYDISNISGQDAVGSRVVFTNGLPDKKQYRKYKIKSVQGPNDFAMMQEVLYRRFKQAQNNPDHLPQLIVVDGGAGQLSSGLTVLTELQLNHLAIIGLAKKHEEIYLPHQSQPLQLSKRSKTITLLTRLRDEAHRFAISYHRQLRSKRLHTSLLDEVEGLGPVKKRALLRQVGSVEAVLDTSIDTLTGIKGIDRNLAEKIIRSLKERQ